MNESIRARVNDYAPDQTFEQTQEFTKKRTTEAVNQDLGKVKVNVEAEAAAAF